MTEIAIPVIVMHEIAFGAYKSSKTEQHLRNFENLGLSKVDFTEDDALCSGKIRAHLAARGTPIGANDTLIAAQALTRDLILVTHNTREFARVPDLKLEDWET
jgi:tRNA(fMet)-specific endonuclease VapC